MSSSRSVGVSKSRLESTFSVQRLLVHSGVVFLYLFLVQSPFSWGSNEYMYFSQALYSDSEASEHFASGYPNPTNLLFRNLVQGAVYLFGLEQGWLILRILSNLFLSFGIGSLFTVLGIGPLVSSVSLALFTLAGESYFGGEWIFRGVEAKVFAYSLGFLSLSLSLASKWRLSSIALILALLFHPLVGGFFLVCQFLFAAFFPTAGKKLRVIGGLGVVLVATGVFALYLSRLGSSGNSESDGLARQIYSVVRHPHHVLPFSTVHPVYGYEVPGFFTWELILLPLGIFVALWLLRKQENNLRRALTRVLLILHMWVPVSLAVAYLDKNSQLFGPYYLFRPMSPILLMAILLVVSSVVKEPRRALLGLVLSFITLLVLLDFRLGELFRVTNISGTVNENGHHTVEVIRNIVEVDESIYVDYDATKPVTGLEINSMELLTGRGQIVSTKFVPTRYGDVLEWFDNLEQRVSAESGNCEAGEQSPWDYALLPEEEVDPDFSGVVAYLPGDLLLVSLSQGWPAPYCAYPQN